MLRPDANKKADIPNNKEHKIHILTNIKIDKKNTKICFFLTEFAELSDVLVFEKTGFLGGG